MIVDTPVPQNDPVGNADDPTDGVQRLVRLATLDLLRRERLQVGRGTIRTGRSELVRQRRAAGQSANRQQQADEHQPPTVYNSRKLSDEATTGRDNGLRHDHHSLGAGSAFGKRARGAEEGGNSGFELAPATPSRWIAAERASEGSGVLIRHEDS